MKHNGNRGTDIQHKVAQYAKQGPDQERHCCLRDCFLQYVGMFLGENLIDLITFFLVLKLHLSGGTGGSIKLCTRNKCQHVPEASN